MDVKHLEGTVCPFSPEGLTVDEITSFYKEAKDKNEAVKILADCCDTTAGNMTAFLAERGLISGTEAKSHHYGPPPQKETERQRIYREKVAKVLELAEKGLTAREAAEILGLPYDSVRTIASRNKISFSGNTKKARKQKGETEMEKKLKSAVESPVVCDYEAECERIKAQLEELQAKYEALLKQTEEQTERCSRQNEENRWLRQKLTAVEAERDRLEAQMEIVYLMCGKWRQEWK